MKTSMITAIACLQVHADMIQSTLNEAKQQNDEWAIAYNENRLQEIKLAIHCLETIEGAE